jgi:hypothetical protein
MKGLKPILLFILLAIVLLAGCVVRETVVQREVLIQKETVIIQSDGRTAQLISK